MQYSRFAALYDMFMDDVDYDKWTDYIVSCLRPLSRTSRIIECGCGTGEITVRLKKLGFDVIGGDISNDMLNIASEKARLQGMLIPFMNLDMRAFRFDKQVEAIIAPCDCVNYLASIDEVKAFFECSYVSLKPGGKLCFDVSSTYKLKNLLGGNTFSDSRKRAAYIWQNNYDDENHLIEMRLEFFTYAGLSKDGTPLYERFHETHIQRAHSEKELRTLLEGTGFRLVGVYSDFSMDAPCDTTERLQFIAEKSGLN